MAKNLRVLLLEGVPDNANIYETDFEVSKKKYKLRYRPGLEEFDHYDKAKVSATLPEHPTKVVASFAKYFSAASGQSSMDIDFIQVPLILQSLERPVHKVKYYRFSKFSNVRENYVQGADGRSRLFGRRRKITTDNPRSHYKYNKITINMKADIDHYKPDVVLLSAFLDFEGLPISKDIERRVAFRDMLESVALVTNTPIVAAVPNLGNLTYGRRSERYNARKFYGGAWTPDEEAPFVAVFNPVNTPKNRIIHHRGVIMSNIMNALDSVKVTWGGFKDDPTYTMDIGRGNSFVAPAWAGLVMGTIVKAAKTPSQQLGKSLAVKMFMANYLRKLKYTPKFKDDVDFQNSLSQLERKVIASYQELANKRTDPKKPVSLRDKDVINNDFNLTQ